MTTKVTVTIVSNHWAPEAYLQNTQSILIERAVQSAIHADVARAFMDLNNKPYLGTPDQISVAVEQKDIYPNE